MRRELSISICLTALVGGLAANGSSAIGAAEHNHGGMPSSSARAVGAEKADKVDGQEWPRLAAGVWQLTTTLTKGGREPKTLTAKTEACTDPSWLFATYFGAGTLERKGCQFSSWQTSSDHYRIETVCMVRHVGASRMKGTVVVESTNGYRMEAELIEGKKQIQIVQTGKWVASCTN